MLFGEKFVESIDPNDPAMLPYIKAKSDKYKNAIKLFYDSGGDVLFNDISRAIKGKIMTCILLDRNIEENIGKSCRMLDDIRRDLNFLYKIEAAIGAD
jgi:hypothetical protein